MSKLVERLREAKTVINGLELGPIDLCVKAADEIERLTAESQATTTAGEALLEHSDEVEADNDRLRAENKQRNKTLNSCEEDKLELQATNERLRAAARKTLKEQDEADEHHSAACMNWSFLEHSQHQCGLCDLREALREDDSER